MRADKARGAGIDDMLALGYLAIVFRLLCDLLKIIADGFRQAGGVHCNDIGVVHRKDGVYGGQQVGLSSEHRGSFGKRAGCCHHRLFVVTGEHAAVVRAAAL